MTRRFCRRSFCVFGGTVEDIADRCGTSLGAPAVERKQLRKLEQQGSLLEPDSLKVGRQVGGREVLLRALHRTKTWFSGQALEFVAFVLRSDLGG